MKPRLPQHFPGAITMLRPLKIPCSLAISKMESHKTKKILCVTVLYPSILQPDQSSIAIAPSIAKVSVLRGNLEGRIESADFQKIDFPTTHVVAGEKASIGTVPIEVLVDERKD